MSDPPPLISDEDTSDGSENEECEDSKDLKESDDEAKRRLPEYARVKQAPSKSKQIYPFFVNPS